MSERLFRGILNRTLQILARAAPGSQTLRVRLHRWRGVEIGQRVWIGYDSIIETSYPWLVAIGDDSIIGLRAIIIGHFRGSENLRQGERSVVIGKQVYIGPGSIILPNVKIGDGAVISAGTVVSRSIPSATLVRGNPAEAVAKCGMPLVRGTTMQQFSRNLRPLKKG